AAARRRVGVHAGALHEPRRAAQEAATHGRGARRRRAGPADRAGARGARPLPLRQPVAARAGLILFFSRSAHYSRIWQRPPSASSLWNAHSISVTPLTEARTGAGWSPIDRYPLRSSVIANGSPTATSSRHRGVSPTFS